VKLEDIPVATKSKSRSRRPPSEIPPEKSKSVSNLPKPIRECLEDTIIPSLKEIYGSCEQLWDIEHGSINLVQELQTLLDHHLPNVNYSVLGTRKDIVYVVVSASICLLSSDILQINL
jgi:hypothetical protein